MTLYGNTDYSLAITPNDYGAANTFLKRRDVDYTGLSFPTIIARREKDVIGVISTVKGEPRITAGPLHVDTKDGHEIFTAIRIVSCYDGVLKKAGITKYWFWAHIENEQLIDTCRQLSSHKEVEMNDNEDYVWFERSL
jgi:hypothetical protein